MSLQHELGLIVENVIHSLYPNLITDTFCVNPSNTHDFQFNRLNHIVAITGQPIGTLFAEISDELLNNHSDTVESTSLVAKGDISFLMITCQASYLENYVQSNNTKEPLNVLIDYSSPNIAKEMHVGHLRSTIIGEALARGHEWFGNTVKRINHVGDWGTQFGMLIAYIRQNNFIDYSLGDLTLHYKAAKVLFDEDSAFRSSALHETYLLQQGDPGNIAIWERIRAISLAAYDVIYQQLEANIEVKGESSYQATMDYIIKLLQEKVTTDDLGRTVLFATGHTVPLILAKSDGAYTYDTSDLAALYHRVTFGYDNIIYVVDTGQSLHFETLFQTASDLGWLNGTKCTHVNFGLVLGNDGKKFKTRSGDTIKLQDVLDEAYQRAHLLTQSLAEERHPEWDGEHILEVSRKIAINCIKYSDLSCPRQSDYRFSYEKMFNTKGNTAIYLMYAYARCRSILAKGTPDIEGSLKIDSIGYRRLLLDVLRYPHVMDTFLAQSAPHYLCNYLYSLSKSVATFYASNKCLEYKDGELTKVHHHRLRLIKMVATIMKQSFDILGFGYCDQI